MRKFFLFLFACTIFLSSLPFLTKKKEKRVWLQTCKASVSRYRPFAILIPSYNNAKYFKKNLQSVLDQRYPHFRVVYIDDASTDGTGDFVSDFLKTEDKSQRVYLLKNTENQGALANLYRAIHNCRDEEICVFLDGDDWFAHDEVLLWLNRAYENKDTWMTYGSYVCYPSYRRGESKKIPQKIHKKASYRNFSKKKFFISHLKSAYTGLLKKIRKEDLMKDGRFYPTSYDQALFLPAIEMAGVHAQYIRDILYIYNRETPLNDDKKSLVTQQYYSRWIQNLPKYKMLTKWEEGLQFAGQASVEEDEEMASSHNFP